MPDLDEMFPSKWLKATDLPFTGVVVTIKSVARETLVDGEKYVVTFNELPKGLVLNVTNGKAIGKLHGKNTGVWVGKKVTLYQTSVPYKGEEVEAIRVRSADPQAEAQTALPLA